MMVTKVSGPLAPPVDQQKELRTGLSPGRNAATPERFGFHGGLMVEGISSAADLVLFS